MTNAAQIAAHAKPIVTLLWRDSTGATQRKQLPWQRPQSDEALAEWIAEYAELIAEGYQPQGFDAPPRPHCARVTLAGRVVAEWIEGGKA